jgi:hypothetical protein
MDLPALSEILAQDDAALIDWRLQAREELAKDPNNAALLALYDQTTSEVSERAAKAWGLFPARTDHRL